MKKNYKKLQLVILLLLFNISIYAQEGFPNTGFFQGAGLSGSTYGVGINSTVRSLLVQPDGKLIVAGDFATYNNQQRRGIVRLDVNGTYDGSFSSGFATGTGGSIVHKIILQPDGKLLVGGSFTTQFSYNFDILRLNTDGSFDETFESKFSQTNSVRDIAIQADGKIIIVGTFTTYDGTSTNRIARLNSDGTLDTTFNIGAAFNNDVFSVVVQPDGKIIVGGNFTQYKAVPVNRILRLNPNGIIDNTFNPGGGFSGTINDIKLQPDGKIIVTGGFTEYDGITVNSLARLNTNGDIDSSFNAGTGLDTAGIEIELQQDGKIIVVGTFTTFNGFSFNRIVRLNTDGSYDNTFTVASGADATVYDAVVQADGYVFIGGNFNAYHGIEYSKLASINAPSTLSSNDFDFNSSSISIYPNPAKYEVNISNQSFSPIDNITIYDVQGRAVITKSNFDTLSTQTLDISTLSPALYMISIKVQDKEIVKRLVIN